MPSRTKLAGVGEDGRAVALDTVEPDAGAGLGHDRRERGLADLKRIAPQVVAVQLDEVEGVEEGIPAPLHDGLVGNGTGVEWRLDVRFGSSPGGRRNGKLRQSVWHQCQMRRVQSGMMLSAVKTARD